MYICVCVCERESVWVRPLPRQLWRPAAETQQRMTSWNSRWGYICIHIYLCIYLCIYMCVCVTESECECGCSHACCVRSQKPSGRWRTGTGGETLFIDRYRYRCIYMCVWEREGESFIDIDIHVRVRGGEGVCVRPLPRLLRPAAEAQRQTTCWNRR